MLNERAFIAKVEAADPEQLANILMQPSLEEEKALRAHLGDERYQRMHSMALKRKVHRSVRSEPKGNVVVIHGIMGGELTVSSGGPGDLTWVNAFRIMRGWIDRLRLSDDGRTDANSEFTVTATGIMKRYYGEMLLSLSEQWNTKAFWFDWRKDLSLAADELNMQIGKWFSNNAPVHIVAHSMGGLVARTFIKKYGDRWKTMWDAKGKGGRLIMLGTPNRGSFSIPQVITGLENLVRKLALLDLRHDLQDLLPTFNSFVGSYQMLPSPLAMPSMQPLYSRGTYDRFNVTIPQQHLDNARAHHELLEDVIDPKRMIYVAGFDQPTFCDIQDWNKLNQTEGYQLTSDGDGRVPHSLGLLEKVPTYYIKDNHGNLSTNSTILAALDELLSTGRSGVLATKLPGDRAVKRNQRQLRADYEQEQADEQKQLDTSLRRLRTRGSQISPDSETAANGDNRVRVAGPALISPEERRVEEALTRGFLAFRGEQEFRTATKDESPPIQAAKIQIGLVNGGIESMDYDRAGKSGRLPIDAIAIGHYIGVHPQNAELKLDEAISAALVGKEGHIPAKSDLVLTQYTERGVIQGKLGQSFLMPDPRPGKNKKKPANRLIAIAGMDEAGSFGLPELTVLARELCWSLGRLKKRHLATVLIGSGEGNLPLREAVAGWISGLRRAVTGSKFDKGRRLERVTFVENDPRKVIQLNTLLKDEAARRRQIKTGFEIDYDELSAAEISALKRKAYAEAKRELQAKWKTSGEQQPDMDQIPSRVTLSLDPAKKTYHFGAITDSASVPERDIVIDPSLVWQANDELAGEQTPAMQLERGRFLEELLMPQDLRKQLYTKAPLVMLLDATTARIHWEMVAQPLLGAGMSNQTPEGTTERFEYEDNFLGTSRGFTRQLRTVFAPPPEPPPPPQRVLRVLVVADPAPDAHLEGAQEEGVMVADLFESYNDFNRESLSQARVEVKRLLGPIEATRTNVLRELMVRSYDVLHFAGHCVYQWDGDPSLSGWIFNVEKKELLTASELYRVDRIPKFVFSNACESGITPDRAQDRNDKLAPGFAEAFFGRGVANFVCTAWPVDDIAARTFADTLYKGLLGMRQSGSDSASTAPRPQALPMHEAMRNARVEIASTPNGRTTWGAYQHYGNPYFRFFYAESGDAGKTRRTTSRRKPSTSAKKSIAAKKKRGSRKSK